MTHSDFDLKSPLPHAGRKGSRGGPDLAAMLRQFQPELHGQEVMPWSPIGVEFGASSNTARIGARPRAVPSGQTPN